MKQIKKLISLIMAVIILFAATPALQAGDFALDRAQMAELQEEILQNVKTDINPIKDPAQALMDRYEQAKIKTEAEIRRRNQQAWEEFKKMDIKNQVVLSSMLFLMIGYEIKYKEIPSIVWGKPVCALGLSATGSSSVMDITAAMIEGLLASGGKLPSGILGLFAINNIAWTVRNLSVIGLLATATMELTISYTPIISPSLDKDETSEIFSKKPFAYLAQFENVFEYSNLYHKCPELLQDSVDIEYYVSCNPTFENMSDKMYVETPEWGKLSLQERKGYLHNLAERLRLESKKGTKEQFNKRRLGLEER